MPGVTLEDPFPIARFHNAIPSAGVGKHFVVDLQPVDQPLATEDDLSENQDQVLISVQSEGVKLYTVSAFVDAMGLWAGYSMLLLL